MNKSTYVVLHEQRSRTWAFASDVRSWTMEEVEDWWRRQGPTARQYVHIVRVLELTGSRLILMKRDDFVEIGMPNWYASIFANNVRELKYDSQDLASRREIKDLLYLHTKFGPQISKLIVDYVREDPSDWDTKKLAKYLKSRGLKRSSKCIRKNNITPQNIDIIIHDPNLPERGRDELSNLFPDIRFYTRMHPHPHSVYGFILSSVVWFFLLIVGLLCIAFSFLSGGIRNDNHVFTSIGCIFFLILTICGVACCSCKSFWAKALW